MHILIVYAHHEPQSFNGALKDRAVSTLQQQGHQVKVSDLYAMNFQAIATHDDFLAQERSDFLKYQAEQIHATATRSFAEDICEEQAKLCWADLVIFQFPLWWFSMPAILKGWIDRVFAMGFVYGGPVGFYDQGGLRGKKAMLTVTTGGPAPVYSSTGLNGDMEQILYHIQHGMLFFSGMEVLPPFIAWSVAHSEQARQQYLHAYEQRLLTLEATAPIPYHPLSHYDENRQLRPEFAAFPTILREKRFQEERTGEKHVTIATSELQI